DERLGLHISQPSPCVEHMAPSFPRNESGGTRSPAPVCQSRPITSSSQRKSSRGGWFPGALRRYGSEHQGSKRRLPQCPVSAIFTPLPLPMIAKLRSILCRNESWCWPPALRQPLAAAHHRQVPGRAAFYEFRTEKGCTS